MSNIDPTRRKKRKSQVQSREFATLALHLEFMGGFLLFVGIGIMCLNWRVGLLGAIPGLAVLVTGLGLARYKLWAWYAAVGILIPLSVSIAVFTVVAWVSSGQTSFAALLAGPAYLAYVIWALLSKSGRQRYRESIAARQAALDNPDSIAGKMLRGRR
jgi:hypothetical protein